MNQEEQNYLDLLSKVLTTENDRSDRTGVGTKSLFGAQLRFSLKDNVIPLLTTRKMFLRAAIEELLFFIRGQTNTKLLEDKGVKIWSGNSSRDFLDKRGLNYPEGEIGPMYGYLWRNFNGIDQLQNMVDLIKNDPHSRRIMMTAYDPSLDSKCVLTPCHTFCQMYVNNGKLDLQWYQRSVDLGLGFPTNVVSYAILTKLIAKITGLIPGELIFSGGDVHCYSNHIEQLNEQILRTPYDFPQLTITKEINSIKDIEKLEFVDFKLENYNFYPALKMKMAI
jgi:thymidylate synthase